MGLKCSKRPPIDWHSSMDESKAPRDKAFPSKISCIKFFHRRPVKSSAAGPTKTSRVKRPPWARPRLSARSPGGERASRETKVIKNISPADGAQAIHPVVWEGQVEGGVMNALGHSLLEEMVY